MLPKTLGTLILKAHKLFRHCLIHQRQFSACILNFLKPASITPGSWPIYTDNPILWIAILMIRKVINYRWCRVYCQES
jgi:hypothetical protein